MAGVWEGFTEEDIGLFRKNNEDNVVPKKTATLKALVKKSVNKGKLLPYSPKQLSELENKISEGARLCKDTLVPLVKKETTIEMKEKESEEEKRNEVEMNENEKEEESEKEKNVGDEKESTGLSIMRSNPVCLKIIEGKGYELVDKNYAEISQATLEVFEARQRTLEEQNKKKKDMLAKVISARKKQTTEEAKRLQHIQEELQKLDILLSNDVGILRNKIEEASLDFVEAQKRYNKAEKEFLDAKQNLFVKLEKKELLTKLLCTIIEQNEIRKAQKLSELMEKLEISESAKCQSALNEIANTKVGEMEKMKQPSW